MYVCMHVLMYFLTIPLILLQFQESLVVLNIIISYLYELRIIILINEILCNIIKLQIKCLFKKKFFFCPL